MDKILSPIKAIRKNCIECSGGSPKEVKLCVIPECPLYLYRLGTNPNRKRHALTDEGKAKASNILEKARQAKHRKLDV